MNWCRETFCENNEKKITSFHVYSTENRRTDQNSSSSFVSENAKIWKVEIITDNIGFDSSTETSSDKLSFNVVFKQRHCRAIDNSYYKLKLGLRKTYGLMRFGEQEKLKCSALKRLSNLYKNRIRYDNWHDHENNSYSSRFDCNVQCHLKILHKGHRLVTGFQT